MRFTTIALLFASAAVGKELAPSLWDWYAQRMELHQSGD